jgi:hypothetical protein
MASVCMEEPRSHTADLPTLLIVPGNSHACYSEEMTEIVRVSLADHRRLTLLARAWNTDTGGAVGRLLDHFEGDPQPSRPPADDERVAVHALYSGERIDGFFDQRTEHLEIVTGALAGRVYRSPSGAAVAVVGLHNKGVNPNRNGWTFWTVTDTNDLLQTIRHQR